MFNNGIFLSWMSCIVICASLYEENKLYSYFIMTGACSHSGGGWSAGGDATWYGGKNTGANKREM